MSDTPTKACFFKTACAKRWTGSRRLRIIAFLAMFILGMATRSLLEQIPSAATASPTFAPPEVTQPAAPTNIEPVAAIRPAAEIDSLREWCRVPVVAMKRNMFAVPLDQFQVDPQQSRVTVAAMEDLWRSLVDSVQTTKNAFANAGNRSSDAKIATNLRGGIAATDAVVAGESTKRDSTDVATDKILAEINRSSRQNASSLEEQQVSQSDYEQALSELSKPTPDIDKAIWLLDCAITADPQNTRASQLNQKLVANRLGETGDATLQAFIRRQALKQTGDSTADAGK
jgi:hypothetical protein